MTKKQRIQKLKKYWNLIKSEESNNGNTYVFMEHKITKIFSWMLIPTERIS